MSLLLVLILNNMDFTWWIPNLNNNELKIVNINVLKSVRLYFASLQMSLSCFLNLICTWRSSVIWLRWAVCVSPPTCNIIGSCLLLSSSHWSARCLSSSLDVRDKFTTLYTCSWYIRACGGILHRAGEEDTLVPAQCTNTSNTVIKRLCAFILTARSHLCAAGISSSSFLWWRQKCFHSTLWMKTHSSVSSWQEDSTMCA